MRTVWGGVVPLDVDGALEPAILAWAKAAKVRRPLLVLDDRSARHADGPAIPSLSSALELAGLAAYAHVVPRFLGLDAVAEGLGLLVFEECDGVVAIGGATAVRLAKTVAFMAGQNQPPAILARHPEAIDRSAIAPMAAIVSDLAGLAALGGSVYLADEAGTPLFLRDQGLRPAVASFVPVPSAADRLDRAVVAACLLDAMISQAADPERAGRAIDGLLRDGAGLCALRPELRQCALSAAGILEEGPGTAQMLATFTAAASGAGYEETLIDLMAALPPGLPPVSAMRAGRLAAMMEADGSTVRAALGRLMLDPLARLTPSPGPFGLQAWIAHLGLDVPMARRRGGRRRRMRA